MSAVGQEFWLIATPNNAQKEGSPVDRLPDALFKAKGGMAFNFDVPRGDEALHFGSFDHLIRLTEELQKYDSQIEGIVHRLERQGVELDPNVQFKVLSQNQEKDFMDYFKTWTWDDAKYPKSRTISDIVTSLMKAVSQFDEESRKKTSEFSELRTQRGNIAKKDQAALLPARDMVDLFTPDVVSHGSSVAHNDFVYSDYLDTVVVILPKGAEVEFLANYEAMAENVVPFSAKRFAALDDKDGNMIWRVVCFKNSTEALKKSFRDKRWLARDFVYDPSVYQKLQEQRAALEKQNVTMFELMKGLYKAAWSDTVVAWLHVKAARVFVESVLRFGMPPSFNSFAVSPAANKGALARQFLATLVPDSGNNTKQGDDEEEIYPYVSISMTPFVVPR